MIVREMPDDQLLCVFQTTHALMAEQFVRYWGNDDFERPTPYDLVMVAVGQHDNGWYEWERKPLLRPDGVPMDFLHYRDVQGKAQLWQRSVRRSWAQHPYAGVLVARHAALLYELALDLWEYSPEDQAVIREFVAMSQELQATTRELFADIPELRRAMDPLAVEANTRLLQFGDRASLQLSIPWSAETTLTCCPTDDRGGYTEIRMRFDEERITFDPWPYHVDQFQVALEGYLLPQRTFRSETEYHQALLTAPFYRRTWTVQPAG